MLLILFHLIMDIFNVKSLLLIFIIPIDLILKCDFRFKFTYYY